MKLIYLSKANLDVKILGGKIIHLSDPKLRKMLERIFIGRRIPQSILAHALLARICDMKDNLL